MCFAFLLLLKGLINLSCIEFVCVNGLLACFEWVAYAFLSVALSYLLSLLEWLNLNHFTF